MRWNGLERCPTLKRLRQTLEVIREQECRSAQPAWGPISRRGAQGVEALRQGRIINKVLQTARVTKPCAPSHGQQRGTWPCSAS